MCAAPKRQGHPEATKRGRTTQGQSYELNSWQPKRRQKIFHQATLPTHFTFVQLTQLLKLHNDSYIQLHNENKKRTKQVGLALV